jgi:phosphoenolpyruvate synthase/pyruvate phosphate dikinase
MKYVKDIKKYKTKSQRVIGFQKPTQVGLLVPPIKVLTHQAFLVYRKRGVLTSEIKKEIISTFNLLRKAKITPKSPKRAAYIGRGFFVPGIEHPPGPRTADINDPKQYLTEIVKFYKFAIDNNYDTFGSDIALVLHPFIHPYQPPLQKRPEVGYPGGCATPVREELNQVIIEAIYGHDEAIQSFPHDTYLVDFKRDIVISKQILNKPKTLKAAGGSKYQKVTLSQTFQNAQVLSDLQILQIAKDFEKVTKRFGPHRLEFILQPEGIIYRECLPFTIKKREEKATLAEGEVLRIKDVKDIQKVQENNKIVFIDPKVIQTRSMDILTSLACNTPYEMTILYPGTATTAHAAIIFREQGHLVVYVKNKVFKTGEKVKIDIQQGQLVAVRLGRSKYTLTLSKNAPVTPAEVGAKAYRLAELLQRNIHVPKSVVIKTAAFEKFLEKNNLLSRVEALTLDKSQEELATLAQRLKKEILKGIIPDDLTQEIKKAFKKLGALRVAVRSSANCEDAPTVSFAGQFETYLNVTKNSLFQSIKKCWASIYTNGVIAYSIANHIPLYTIKMAIILQEMIDAEKAGVIFTKDVIKNDNSKTVIEATSGLGEKVVSGTVHPDRIIVDKGSQEIVSQKISSKKVILTRREVKTLTNLSLQIEQIYLKPQDIEWAIKNEAVFILQTRPITT